jgi:hypothetical protein
MTENSFIKSSKLLEIRMYRSVSLCPILILLRRLMKRQLAFMIARAQVPVEWLQPSAEENPDGEEDEFPEDLLECLGNTRLSQSFRFFGKEMGVEDAKSLEDIYKSHLENTREHWILLI